MILVLYPTYLILTDTTETQSEQEAHKQKTKKLFEYYLFNYQHRQRRFCTRSAGYYQDHPRKHINADRTQAFPHKNTTNVVFLSMPYAV